MSTPMQNEICLCGYPLAEHEDEDGNEGKGDFCPGPGTFFPAVLLEAVRDLCEGSPVDNYASRVMVSNARLYKIRAMLNQIKGGEK